MDTTGGPDAKKARWSPTSFGNSGNGSNNRDAFANYGYGPQAGMSQGGFNGGSPSGGFASNALYSTPSLTINTASNGNGMPSQLSPNPASTFPQQVQTPISANGASPYLGFGYNMLGMGIPGMGVLGMGGFPYGAQMGNFQVRIFFSR